MTPTCKTAVVLAAGKISPALTAVFGKTSSAMIPVNGRPVIHRSIGYLRELGIERVLIATRENDERLGKLLADAFGGQPRREIVPITEDRGPGYSLLCCLRKIDRDEPVLVVLGDTLFALPDRPDLFATPFVLTHPVEDSVRWCLADVAADGTVRALADKPGENPRQWPALIGVYHLKPAAPALDRLEARAKESPAASLQLSDALEPYVAAGALRAHPAVEWLDCGNLDMLTSSRRRLLATRSFNRVEVDDLRGTITKRSANLRKFTHEINYYRLLPPDLAIFFPRLLAFDLAADRAFLTLEYYGYPTLSEMWVFESFDVAVWKNVFASLREILRCFAAYRTELPPAEIFRFYWQKTVDRVADFAQQDALFRQWTEAPELAVNGRPLRGWAALAPTVEIEVERLSRRTPVHVIHGDLCFPNILFDPVSRLFKLLDPRGSFADAGIYGDSRYDAAKLLHSIDGGYDFLIHDMFSVRYGPASIDLEQFFPASRPEVLARFEAAFADDYNLRDLRLIEALLFISMCPLHADHPPRQAAMFAIGLRLLNELFP